MEEQKFIWMDGKLIPWQDANIHILTHGLHYGTAVFEGIRAYNTYSGPAVFRLPEHIDRLYRSAEAFAMTIPHSKEEFSRAVIETIRANSLQECYIRPIVWLGYGKMGLCPVGVPVNCAVIAWPWGAYLSKPMVDAIVSRYIRVHPRSGEMAAKISGVYYNSALASLEAKRADADEAILLDADGFVAEGPGENIFIVTKDKFLVTPPLGTILPGITRATVLEMARELKNTLPIEGIIERPFTVEELKNASEAFFTGTAVEITGIGTLDGTPIGDGKMGVVTTAMRCSYSTIIHGVINAKEHWLSYVYWPKT